MKQINAGIIGFGTIGAGVVKLISENADVVRRKLGVSLVLKKVADLDIITDRGVTLPPEVSRRM